jgi:tetratricopeptide (TPR) repeat protein
VKRLPAGPIVLALCVAGCPAPYVPPPKTAASVKAADLPSGAPELVAYIDEQDRVPSPASVENELVAVDKGLAADPKSYELNWRGARACAWLTEEFQKARRAEYAKRGMQYAKNAIAVDGKRAEAQYYLGINIGQLATTRTVGGYLLVPQVVKAAELAVKANEKLDHAGPLRLLGAVYAQAPTWPASVGDIEEGLTHLGRAVELARDYPQNHLLYADALLKDGKLDQAEHEYEEVLKAPDVEGWARRLAVWKRRADEQLRKIDVKRGRQPRPSSVPPASASAGAGQGGAVPTATRADPAPRRSAGTDEEQNGTPAPR